MKLHYKSMRGEGQIHSDSYKKKHLSFLWTLRTVATCIVYTLYHAQTELHLESSDRFFPMFLLDSGHQASFRGKRKVTYR